MERLLREHLAADPIDQFRHWFDEMKARRDAGYPEPVCLSTVDADGWPDSRMVLLKHVDSQGFIFYTNMHSPKARALIGLPRAAMCFYWAAMRRQVRVRGTTQRVTEQEADEYWRMRPRESQIAAWVSQQSEPVSSPEFFERRTAEVRVAFGGRTVPRPTDWSGFRVMPLRMEFWQERQHRLHDRFVYVRNEQGGWDITQLYP